MGLGQMRNGSMDNETVTVYTVERRLSSGWSGFQPSRRDTGEPLMTHQNAHLSKDIAPLEHDFSASGACWQRYGIHGTFDEEIAIQCAIACRKNQKYAVRVMRRTYKVEAEELLVVN